MRRGRDTGWLLRRALPLGAALGLLVAVGAGVLGAGAQVATTGPRVEVDRGCYTEQTPVDQQGPQPPIVITGSGFTPQATVAILAVQGEPSTDTASGSSIGLSPRVTATVDAQGNFTRSVPAPDLGTIRVTGLRTNPPTADDPHPSDEDWEPWSLVASQPEPGSVSALTATTSFHVASFSFTARSRSGSRDSALSGARDDLVTWRFSGFATGSTVYGHFIQGARVVTHSFGRSTGPCDVLTVPRTQRLPVPGAQRGRWRLQLDTQRRYSARTTPRIRAGLSDF